MDGIYAFDINMISYQQAIAAPEKNVPVTDIRHKRTVHAVGRGVKRMADKVVAKDMYRNQHSAVDERSLCSCGRTKGTLMSSRTHLKGRPEETMHTDVTAMNVPLIGAAMYFFTFFNESPGHLRLLHMISKG